MLLLNNSQQWPPKSYEQDIYKNIFRSFDWCLCPTGRMPQLFCVFGDFYVSGTEDTEVTKSLFIC